MAFDTVRSVTVLFGGAGQNIADSGETWEWNGTVWTPLLNAGLDARLGHAMIYDAARGTTVLFGGSFPSNATFSDQTWGLSGSCYPNCDGSTNNPVLNVNDFQCFLNRFATADPYANCDGSTAPPALNVNDFQCFVNAFAAGCS
jgi:hypothetical protein